jgi:hypothetical protein
VLFFFLSLSLLLLPRCKLIFILFHYYYYYYYYYCFKDLLNNCDIKTRVVVVVLVLVVVVVVVEVEECFRRVATPENNQRPDPRPNALQSTMLQISTTKPVVADVCITCPIIPVAVAASTPLSLSHYHSLPRRNLDAQLK